MHRPIRQRSIARTVDRGPGRAAVMCHIDVVLPCQRLTGQNYVYVTHDGGATWTAIDGSGDGALPDGPVHSIVIDPLNNQTLYVGTELGVFTSIDGGNSWMADVNDF